VKLAERQILVVDDNTDVRELIIFVLDQEGFVTHSAKDGPSALEVINQTPLDLILLDVMMPGMSGLEVLQDIRRQDRDLNQKVPTVMISAMAQAQDLEEAMSSGATSYIVKPFRPNVLLQRVTDLLNQTGEMTELARS
jgi:CheY-like chemotaxis protein